MQASQKFCKLANCFTHSLERLSPFYLKVPQHLLLPSVACFALLSIYIVQFSRCSSSLFRDQVETSVFRCFDPTSKEVVGPSGLEPPTSRLSVVRSSQLSYGPVRFAALQRAPSKLNNVTTLRSTITDLGHCSKLSSAEFSLERR